MCAADENYFSFYEFWTGELMEQDLPSIHKSPEGP